MFDGMFDGIMMASKYMKGGEGIAYGCSRSSKMDLLGPKK
jgi:hypothetical protein